MSHFSFHEPQRQSKVGLIVLFANTVQQYARGIWPLALIFLFRFEGENKVVYLVLATLFVLLLTGVISWLRYLNFTFFLNQEQTEFIITDGIFNKTQTIIQLHKIQQVNLSQTLLHRLVEVYAVEVDTAGSNQKEAKIRAVSNEIALALKEVLLQNPANFETDMKEETLAQPESVFLKISPLSLLKYGLTSNYLRTLGLVLAFFVTIYENLRQFVESSNYQTPDFDSYLEQDVAMTTGTFFGILFILAIFVLNVIRVFFKYYDFKIIRQASSLLLSFGLVNTKSTLLKPERIQSVTASQNYFQKKLDIMEIKVKQASGGEESEKKSAIEIPGCSALESAELLKLLFGDAPQKGIQLLPNYRKLVVSLVLIIVIPLVCGYYFLPMENRQSGIFIALIYAVTASLLSFIGFKNYRLFLHDQFIIKQSGIWDISNQIIEPAKIQAVSVSQLFWHKKPDICTLTLYTAGGMLRFDLGNYSQIKRQVNQWLYKIENSDSNWM